LTLTRFITSEVAPKLLDRICPKVRGPFARHYFVTDHMKPLQFLVDNPRRFPSAKIPGVKMHTVYVQRYALTQLGCPYP